MQHQHFTLNYFQRIELKYISIFIKMFKVAHEFWVGAGRARRKDNISHRNEF